MGNFFSKNEQSKSPVSTGDEEKQSNQTDVLILKEDGYHYIIDGLKVTGTGIILRKKYKDETAGEVTYKFNVCEENRVAMSKDEQERLGSQPYMLNKICLDKNGEVIPDELLGKWIYKRMNKLSEVGELLESEAWAFVSEARYNCEDFADRHFPMALNRERIKKNETINECAVRLLSEELYRKFKNNKKLPKYKFIHELNGKRAIVVYFVDEEDTETDQKIIDEKGKSNYFCAKDIAEFGRNDILETRNHRFCSEEEVDKLMNDFLEKNKTKDLSRWGGKTMWVECKKHF